MRNRGVVAEPRTAAVVRSSDAVMDKIMTTIHNDDELRVLCQSEGARAFSTDKWLQRTLRGPRGAAHRPKKL